MNFKYLVKCFIDDVEHNGFVAALKKVFYLLFSCRSLFLKSFYLLGDDASISSVKITDSNHTVEAKVKAIAFYLPQFHAIPENNEWWEQGFTEWSNVKKGVPFFAHHYQPHVPHSDLGYYDLNNKEVMDQQVAMAKDAGLYGFCFYHYWFAGKRLLEMPVNRILQSNTFDFPFCLCWANENWTRTWDGKKKEVLIEQNYSVEDDYAFIKDVIIAFKDKRYIRVNEKPMLLIYRPTLLPKPKQTFELWRDYCRKQGLDEIHLVGVASGNLYNPIKIGLDAIMEFPPANSGAQILKTADGGFCQSFKGHVFDYRQVRHLILNLPRKKYPHYRGVLTSWDNIARRSNNGTILVNSSPASYYAWLREAVRLTIIEHKEVDRFVFINAWNEWAEGCHLEPDDKYGYAWLNATKQALSDFSK